MTKDSNTPPDLRSTCSANRRSTSSGRNNSFTERLQAAGMPDADDMLAEALPNHALFHHGCQSSLLSQPDLYIDTGPRGRADEASLRLCAYRA